MLLYIRHTFHVRTTVNSSKSLSILVSVKFSTVVFINSNPCLSTLVSFDFGFWLWILTLDFDFGRLLSTQLTLAARMWSTGGPGRVLKIASMRAHMSRHVTRETHSPGHGLLILLCAITAVFFKTKNWNEEISSYAQNIRWLADSLAQSGMKYTLSACLNSVPCPRNTIAHALIIIRTKNFPSNCSKGRF
jgi:hypothetical protein